jgi:hypothetical protein
MAELTPATKLVTVKAHKGAQACYFCLTYGSCRSVSFLSAMNSRPKSASAARVLCAAQRRLRLEVWCAALRIGSLVV